LASSRCIGSYVGMIAAKGFEWCGGLKGAGVRVRVRVRVKDEG
jgi:hypothetical protein